MLSAAPLPSAPPPLTLVPPGTPPAGATNVYLSAAPKTVAPPPAQTRTSTVPVVAGGVNRTICVSLAETKLVGSTAAAPNSTLHAPIRPVPLIVNSVPPAAEPLTGLTPVMTGIGHT